MIKLEEVNGAKSFVNQLVLEVDEPMTMTLAQTETGQLIIYVYEGTGEDVDEYTEPIIIFNSDADPKVLDLNLKKVDKNK